LLAMFDTSAPGHPKPLPTTNRLKQRWSYWEYRVHLHWSNLKLSQGERWKYIGTKTVKWFRGKGVQFREWRYQVKQILAEKMVTKEIRKTRQAGRRAAESYVARPYPGRITLFRATERLKGYYFEPLMGWDDLVRGGIDVCDTPGHHGAIMRDPRARILAAQLKESLQKASQPDQAMSPEVAVNAAIGQS
jgi:hypothetical protein